MTLAAALLSDTIAYGQTYALVTLASFDGAHGATPYGKLTLSGGLLYGTTSAGGDADDGTVFSLPTTGGVPTTLTSFHGADGANPAAGLTLTDGFLYGTTVNGGAFGYGTDPDGNPLTGDGTVFSLPTGGGTPTTLVDFDYDNGAYPVGGLISIGNTLYGTTFTGGATRAGTVFSIPTGGGALTTLTSFFNGAHSGANPAGNLTVGGNGTLYGATQSGGPSRSGTVFSLPMGGGTATTLANLSQSVGQFVHTDLLLVGSTLYGVASAGGARGDGTLFSVPISGGTPTVLASFDGADGVNPIGALTLIGGTLYGTAQAGGASHPEEPYSGDGTVFSVPLAGGDITVLASFDFADGSSPGSGITPGSDGILYGTTETGGEFGDGTVFALVPTPEPSSLATLGMGMLGLAGLTRQARRR